jgi:hypothetical protein
MPFETKGSVANQSIGEAVLCGIAQAQLLMGSSGAESYAHMKEQQSPEPAKQHNHRETDDWIQHLGCVLQINHACI